MIIRDYMDNIGRKSVLASSKLKSLSTESKNKILISIARKIRADKNIIILANEEDVKLAREKGAADPMINRLILDENKIENIAKSVEAIAELPDPVGKILFKTERPNGLLINKISVPLGVIGIIYESRPNVTVDASVLCIKAGNACILRGGSESYNSNLSLAKAINSAIIESEVDENIIQFVETTDRAAVDYMLRDMVDHIDVIIPRGGKGLVKKVQDLAKVPVIGHLDGICHIYVNNSADLDTAIKIIHNAKLRRTEICGAVETLLIDEEYAKNNLPKIISDLMDANCEVRGDADSMKIDNRIIPAKIEDWSTEYLDSIISVKLVKDVYGAIDHIAKYGSGHTESIISENNEIANEFLRLVDSAIVMHNASTQFADGGEFGLGAEIGIATGRLHARGPVGLEALTTFKYIVKGSGQIRSQ